MCSFLNRNTFSWELGFGLESSELDPKLGAKEMDSMKAEKCAHPALFVRDNVGQVLQRRVSSNGKDAGDRLCVPTRRMQRQNALAIALSPVEIPSRLHRRRNMKKFRPCGERFPRS